MRRQACPETGRFHAANGPGYAPRWRREFFAAEHGRPPQDARELAAAIAKHSRPQTTAVAGYDLTFSPVKSVSTLWALAEPAVAARIEKAHRAAVADALSFIEQHALFSRTGANGVRQVNVQGLVAAAFTHRDSRAGDPDLHTHVAVANKVQTLDGRWLSIDGRILFKATVAASETYNTALEHHLRDSLGAPIRRTAGPGPAETAGTRNRRRPPRPDRPVVGPSRRHRNPAGRACRRLPTEPMAAHPPRWNRCSWPNKPPWKPGEAKHQPRSLAEQRKAWFAQAADVLGGPDAVQPWCARRSAPSPSTARELDAAWLETAADRVLSAMEERRSTWQIWHVRAEAQRYIRAADVPTAQADRLVDLLVHEVLNDRSVSLARPDDASSNRNCCSDPTAPRSTPSPEPSCSPQRGSWTPSSGWSPPQGVATDTRSPQRRWIWRCWKRPPTASPSTPDRSRSFATCPPQAARLQLAIAPAGTGKTTAMRALATAWRHGGGTVIGLAPTAAAAAVLRDQIHTHCETLAKLTTSLHQRQLPDWAAGIGPSTLVVIDEAGMADTLSLDAAVSLHR